MILSHSESFISDSFVSALEKSRRTIRDSSGAYAICILNEMLTSSQLVYSVPLALMLATSLEKTITERAAMLQTIGDVALVQVGLLYKSINLRHNSPSYFVHMGVNSYRSAGQLQRKIGMQPALGDTLLDLAEDFDSVAEVFRILAQKFFASSQENLLLEASMSSDACLLSLAERGIFIDSTNINEVLQ